MSLCPSIPSGIVVSPLSSGLCSYIPQRTCDSPFTLNPSNSNCEYQLSSSEDSCPLSSTKTAARLCSYSSPQSCSSPYILNNSLCKYSLLPPTSPSSPSLPLPIPLTK